MLEGVTKFSIGFLQSGLKNKDLGKIIFDSLGAKEADKLKNLMHSWRNGWGDYTKDWRDGWGNHEKS